MNLAPRRTHDVFRVNSTNQQGICDEQTMTASRNRFGAHQHDLPLVRELDRFVEALRKLGRLHVIRITSKGGVPPAHVERIVFRMTQPAESRQVNVSQAGFLQWSGQGILVKLRIVPGTGHCAHITTQDAPWACSRSMNSSSVRVE